MIRGYYGRAAWLVILATVVWEAAAAAQSAPITATLTGPGAIFADDAPAWQVEVRNASGAQLHGALSLRSDKDASCAALLAADLDVAAGAQAQFAATLPPLPIGDQKLDVVWRDAAGQEQVLGSTALTVFDQLRPTPGLNLVRNASFELGPVFSGTPMREGAAYYQMFVNMQGLGASGNQPHRWTPLDTEGWWAEGPSAEGVAVVTGKAHSGDRCLQIIPPASQTRAVESALNRMVPPGPVTLSAWVKTEGCTGQLDLDLDAGQGIMAWECMGNPTVRKILTLPTDTDWTRLTVTAIAPSLLQALARLQVDKGTAWLDDVQIEAAPAVSAFNLRPEEWLRLSLAGVGDAALAKWLQGDKTPRQLTIYDDSRVPLAGTVHIRMGSWDHPTQRELGTFAARPGPVSVALSTADLPVNAYVITLALDQNGKIAASGVRDFAADESIGGIVSNGDLRARTAVRFAIAPNMPPAKIFGVGNCVLYINGSGGWFGGWTLAGWAEARTLGLTTCRFQPYGDATYLCAAAGVTMTPDRPRCDEVPPGDEALGDPVNPGTLDIWNPAGWAAFVKHAEDTGRLFGANPFIVEHGMSGESPYPGGGMLCPTTYADADFRAWCQKKYGNDLSVLNGHWGTSFSSWDQVEQIASARYLAEVKAAPVKQGAAALDWMAKTGTFSEAVMERMQAHPGWSMDWVRWWTASSLRMYFAFREHARQFDHKTLYGDNLAWPAFWPQMWMPFLRGTDNGQVDIQYTAGMPRGLGTPSEMMDSMEMTEATVPGKPIWGHEIYYQPQWPPEFIALQNWGMLAHGMTNDMTFAWHPYSDHGLPVGTHAWEKPDAWPMWFLIDNDGTKLPAYYSYLRSIKEINRFHQQFDGLSLKRAATNVGFYVSPDTGCYVLYATGNQPWNSVWQRTRNTLIFALRMSGVTVRYLDDISLPTTTAEFKTIIVPASYLLSQPAAEKLAAFTKAGGTLILAGMSGVMDPWLNKYANIGGPAWADLNWRAPSFAVEQANQVFTSPSDSTGPPVFHGTDLGTMPGATPITGPQGTTIGWTRSWGQGKLLAYGIVPDAYSGDPHVAPEMLAWLDQWRLYADVPFTGRWISGDERKLGTPGLGSEVVEVVVREKSPSEKFVFCLNQGGAGLGSAEVTVGGGNWHATDALTGEPVAGTVAGGVWQTPLSLDAFGYRVIRLVKS